jgi:hypothetical protein
MTAAADGAGGSQMADGSWRLDGGSFGGRLMAAVAASG